MALIALSPWDYGLDGVVLEDYLKSFDLFLSECRAAREEGLVVSCLAGFHPAAVDHLVSKGLKPGDVLELGLNVIEHVKRLVEEGELDGIGEVGRQHYKTHPYSFSVAERILDAALEKAKDLGCLIHLHLENAGIVTVRDVAERLYRIGVSRDKAVFHHTRPGFTEHVIAWGFPATTPAIEGSLRRLLEKNVRGFMVESDYIDDARRPGSVVYPWLLPVLEEKMVQEGLLDEDEVFRINYTYIERIYNVTP